MDFIQIQIKQSLKAPWMCKLRLPTQILFQITSSSTKKLWDNKSDIKSTGSLAPLQMPSSNEHQMWSKEHQGVWSKDQQMWSTQDNSMRRNDNTMTGILRWAAGNGFKNVRLTFFFSSPRDSTGGLGVKMVEYVLGGSPTNKESPLALEPRLRGLKIDEVKVIKYFMNCSLESWAIFKPCSSHGAELDASLLVLLYCIPACIPVVFLLYFHVVFTFFKNHSIGYYYWILFSNNCFTSISEKVLFCGKLMSLAALK